MPDRQFVPDGDLVGALLADQHPDLAHLALVEFARGWDNVVFRLGRQLAVRLPRREVAATLIENELRWLPGLARRLPIPVSEPLRAGAPGRGYPWPWAVAPWIPGTIAALEGPADPDAAARVLGEFVTALHRPAPDDAPHNPFRGVPLEARAERTEADLDAVAAAGTSLDVDGARRTWRNLIRTQVWSDAPVWLHGDLHPANVIVERGEITGVIDFGDLTAGDPATDLMIAWSLLPPASRPVFRRAAGDVDDDTWFRAKAWALSHGAACLAHGNDPVIRSVGECTMSAVLADA